MSERRKGFTLLELLVVLSIVAVLAALLMPVTRRVRARSQAVACVSNLRQLGMGLQSYLSENDQTMPVLAAGRETRAEEAKTIDNTLDRYVSAPKVFACPADDRGLAEKTGTSYFWNPALNGQRTSNLTFLTIDAASRIPILSDKEGFHLYRENKVNILFADGHATQDARFFVGE